MYTLTLTDEEHQALMDILECAVEELHSEIVHTDRRDYRDCLKDRRQLLLKLLADLRQDKSPA